MLTDLVAAPAEEASALLASRSHANAWPTLPAKTVDKVKLASLAFILKGEPPDDDPVIEYMRSFKLMADGGENGPWIELLPRDLVERLERLPGERVPVVASAWAETEEARLDGWKADDTEEFLRALTKFAAEARASGRDLLLWVCL